MLCAGEPVPVGRKMTWLRIQEEGEGFEGYQEARIEGWRGVAIEKPVFIHLLLVDDLSIGMRPGRRLLSFACSADLILSAFLEPLLLFTFPEAVVKFFDQKDVLVDVFRIFV